MTFWVKDEDDIRREKVAAWFAAVKRKNVPEMRAYLAQGVNVDAQDGKGRTALHLVVLSRNRELAVTLVEMGAQINVVDKRGRSAVHNFILKHVDSEYDGWSNVRSDAGRFFGDFLMSLKLNLNLQDAEGNTPLHLAVRKKREFFLKTLQDNEANPMLRNKEDTTSAEMAIATGWKASDCTQYETSFAQKRVAAANPPPPLPVPMAVAVIEQPAPSPWRRTGDTEISRVTVKESIRRTITEIFNFEAATYTQISQNMDTQAEAMAVIDFNRFSNPGYLLRAAEELEKQGGKIPVEGLPLAVCKRRVTLEVKP